MNTLARLFPLLLATTATAGHAADNRLALAYTDTDYSGIWGERELVALEGTHRHGDNALVVQLATGERRYGDGTEFEGQAVAGSLHHDWAPAFSTRTALAWGSDDPLFVRRLFEQELVYKPAAQATVSLGARYARYYGRADTSAWYVSGAWYVARLSLRYRYTRYSLAGVGDSDGHLLSLRLRDGRGHGVTQLWLGRGDPVNAYEWSPVPLHGEQRAVSLRRVQPLSAHLALDLRVERTWYDTPVDDYRGTGYGLGLVWDW